MNAHDTSRSAASTTPVPAPRRQIRVPRRPVVAAVLAAAALGGCTGATALRASDLERLRTVPEIPAAYTPSFSPSVDCSTNEGNITWSFGPESASRVTPQARQPAVVLASARTMSAPYVLASDPRGGTVWESYEREWTRQLSDHPPRDPAQATSGDFLVLARGAASPLRFAERARRLESAAPSALAAAYGPGPVLVFETTRFVLAGCWFTYQPWFNVRASIVDAGSGRVLWRDACGGLYPPALGSPQDSYSREQLEANGSALYARLLDERARSCARDLLSRFERSAAAAARAARPGR